jgi:hypothetical protein
MKSCMALAAELAGLEIDWQAWLSGFDGMDGFLSGGGVLLCDHCGQELKK